MRGARVKQACFSEEGVTAMKVVAVVLLATVVLTTGISLAFADCAGHTKAQLVKSQPQEQLSTDQSTATPITVAEKVDEPAQPVVKAPE